MEVKEHYDSHLANFYSWMVGDFKTKQKEFLEFLNINNINPTEIGNSLDFGCGHGIQSTALALAGFNVKAIDFNRQLLDELKENSKGLKIDIIEDDIRIVSKYKNFNPELIVCCGDTITHLASKNEIEKWLFDSIAILANKGKIVLSFRDYSFELKEEKRFIPVKSDNNKILTCFLEYYEDYLNVTDLLYEKQTTGWKQKVSSYKKVRIDVNTVINILVKNSMTIILHTQISGLVYIIAQKG